MELVTIEAVTPRAENPFVDDVKALIKASEAYTGPEGTRPAGKFVVANADANKTIYYIQQAAIEEGVTARIASKLENGQNSKGSATRNPVKDVDGKGNETGMTTLLFKITPKRKENGRVRKGGTVDTGADVPAE